VHCASSQVDVLDSEGDRLAGTQSCLGEQPDQSLVAAVAQRWPLAGGEERAELPRRQDRHDLAVELRLAYSRTVPSASRSARRWMVQLSSSARRSGAAMPKS
jgi:hypothetical protein